MPRWPGLLFAWKFVGHATETAERSLERDRGAHRGGD